MIKQKNHSLPEDHQILLCCPQIMENDVFGIVVEKTCDNVESCDHTCQHQYQPSMRQNEGLNTYETGYEVVFLASTFQSGYPNGPNQCIW